VPRAALTSVAKANWCVEWMSTQAYFLEAYSLDVAVSYCTEAPFGYLKLKLDCISGFLHPECDVLFFGFSALSLLNFQKTNSIPAVVPLSGR